jgi:predicted transcriptional regulator
MAKQAPTLLTDAELELMLILWQLGEGSVKEILAALPKSRKVAYTTASTIVRIMEKKGFVGSRKQGRGHVYFPEINKEEYESRTLGHVVDKVFNQTPASLVARLIEDKRLSEEELAEIRRMLNKGDN